MTVLEFLASQLDREATNFDTPVVFTENIEFWNLCLEAKRFLIDEGLAKQGDKNVTHNG